MAGVLTIRLDTRSRKRLERLASATARSKSFLAAEAIRAYLDVNQWQIDEIQKALKEADRGEFASEAEVKAVFSKWAKRAR